MKRTWFYTQDTPVAFQSLAMVSNIDKERETQQAEVLRAAEAGDEEAIAVLKAKGLRRWEKHGRRIL